MSAVRGALWLLLIALASGCGPPQVPARTSDDAPPSERELDSARRVAEAECGPGLGLLFPGVGQFCQGKPIEGAVLTSLAAAEIGTAVGVAIEQDDGLDGLSHPAAAVPLVGVQNLWIYAYADAVFDRQRAARLRYVPQDSLAELALAPFNFEVLSKTDVWLGTLVATAFGVGLSAAIDESFDSEHAGEDPNLFGKTLDAPIGYPLAGGVGIALFEHVAIGEESMFRGLLQSHMAREGDETSGWLGASLVFGVAHAPNALLLPSRQRARYLFVGVPAITLLGSFLGLSYQWHDYSLAAPVAIHFWYDLLLSATFFALDPKGSPLSASFTLPL